MYIQVGPADIRTPTPWNLIGLTMTAPPPVLSPSSILPSPSSHNVFHSHNEKFGASLKILLFHFSVLLTQFCAGGKIEKDEMGGACGAYGGGERCAQGSGWQT